MHDSKQGILRTTGIKATAWFEERAKQTLIKFDWDANHFAYEVDILFHALPNLVIIIDLCTLPTPGLANMTISTDGRRLSVLNASRNMRLTRLRSCALAIIFFDKAKPNLAWPTTLSRYNIINSGVTIFFA